MIGYWLVKLISKALCVLPEEFSRWLGKSLGSLVVFCCPGWRIKMAVHNIRQCLGIDEETAKTIARESLERFGPMAVEVLRFPLLNKDNILEKVQVEGWEHLEAAAAEGRGIVMTTGHFGNWELLGALIGLRGFRLLSIARHQNQGGMNKLINEYREMVGQEITYNRGENHFFQIVRKLKQKYVIGVIFDQDTNDIGANIPIFGKQCIVPDGAAALSRIDKAPIVPIFIHDDKDGVAKARIYPPLHCNDKNDYTPTMEKLVGILENEIRENPSMWFWVHDRWKDGREISKK